MARRTWKFPFLDIFKAEASGVGESPDQYLKLSTKCIEYVQKMNSIQFNHEQCMYLAYNLKIVVEHASSFLKRINSNGGSFLNSSPQVTAKVLEIFKLLFTLAKEVECFIKDCCKNAWIPAAVALTNESERVLSMTFNLRISEMIFSDNEDWGATQAEVGNLLEVENVRMKASMDKENLVMKLRTSIQLNKLSNEEHELATFLLGKLHLASDAEGSSQRNFFERDIMNLRRVRQLGKGATAVVHQTTWLGMDVAMKTFDGPNNAEFRKEVSNLVGLCHSNIAGLLCYGEDDRECSIIMELMDEDLEQMMRNILHDNKGSEVPFTILEAIGMMLQIAQGMYYLHEMKIVHRDLKAANILVSIVKAEGVCCVQAKVADFGLSRTKETSKTNSYQKYVVGTSRWMAPEVINCRTGGNKVDNPFKSDVYSFAMVCYEILTGNTPFPTTRQADVWDKVLAGHRPDLPVECPEELSNLITKCWSAEASIRPDFGDICVALRHLKCELLFRCKRLANDVLAPHIPPSRDSEIYVHDGGIIFELADFGTSSSLDWSQFMRFSPELEEALPNMRRSHLLLLKTLVQVASASNQAYSLDLRPDMWIRTIIRLHSHGVKEFICLNSEQIQQINATISVHSNVVPCYLYRSRLRTLSGGRAESPIKREYFPSAFLDETLSTGMSLMEKLKKGNGKGEQFPFVIQGEEGAAHMSPRHSLLKIAPSDVTVQKLIKECGGCDVWEVVWQGGQFARKDFKWEFLFHRELEVARKVSHPNVVYIFGIVIEEKQLSFIMELLDSDLSSLIYNKLRLRGYNRPPFSPKGSTAILLQIAKAMAYLHDLDILHMDLVTRKILLRNYEILGDENQYVVKVAGFSDAGVVKPISSSSFQGKDVPWGTTKYAPPEVLAARYDKTVEIQHPKKIDIYNFGSVAYEILTGNYPYGNFYERSEGLTPPEVRIGVIGGTLRPCLREACSRPNFWNDVHLIDLIESCWHHNPQDRPSFSAVLDGLERIQKKLLEQTM